MELNIKTLRVHNSIYDYKLNDIDKSVIINYSCVYFGKQIIIGPNTVIGFDGLRVVKDEKGINHTLKHIGIVLIKNNVWIGSSCTIDRASFNITKIGKNTKIGNQVHIAHNVLIGENCIITAGSLIAGSSILGDNVYIGIGAIIKNKVSIGNNAFIGMGSVVAKDVKANTKVFGNPARRYE